jgi:hypothetical protein
MPRIWNITAAPLVLDWSQTAIRAGFSTNVTDQVAAELSAGPDWSLEDPRQPRNKADTAAKISVGEEA